MTLKEEMKKSFSDNKQKNLLRSSSSKIIFLIMVLLFFMVFYITGAGIGKDILGKIISPIYLLLIISLNIFIYFLGQKLFFTNKIYSYILSLIFGLISIFFILPIII